MIDSVWVMDNPVETELIFTVEKQKISVNDSAKSVYRLYSDGKDSTCDDFDSTTWLALDEEYRKVKVRSVQYKSGEFIFVVEYSDQVYIYTLNKLLD